MISATIVAGIAATSSAEASVRARAGRHHPAIAAAMRSREGGRQISRALQVKDNTLLATLQRGVGHGLPGRAARRVHVDDLCSLVRQEQSGEGTGQPLAKINHPDAVQSTSHAFSPVPIGGTSTYP